MQVDPASSDHRLLPGHDGSGARDSRQHSHLEQHLANDAVSAIEVFSAGNTIATGTFNYDNTGTPDVEFSTFKLPLSYAFGSPTNRF